MTSEIDTNIEYALGLTQISAPNSGRKITFRLGSLLKEKGISYFGFANLIETSPATVKRYVEGAPHMRIETLLAMAKGLGVSVDYLLGLTDYKTWNDYRKKLEPFSGVAPGDAIYLEFPDEGLNGCALMHPHGGKVVFPTGKMRSIRDEIFQGVIVQNMVKADED